MYLPDDPLFPFNPIFQSISDEKARKWLIRNSIWKNAARMGARFHFDIVLRGQDATPSKKAVKQDEKDFVPIPSQTGGPVSSYRDDGSQERRRLAMEGAKGERIRLVILFWTAKAWASPTH